MQGPVQSRAKGGYREELGPHRLHPHTRALTCRMAAADPDPQPKFLEQNPSSPVPPSWLRLPEPPFPPSCLEKSCCEHVF